MGLLDVALIILIAGMFILALRQSVKKARKGGCCGNCSDCGRECATKKENRA